MNCDQTRPGSAPAPARPDRSPRAGQSAFTMVEIALCLGVIAFALVAIIGVMPLGLRVQQENREDTILNQDATVWIEAIRSGWYGIDANDHLRTPDLATFEFGMDTLTNYVLAVAVSNNVDGVRIYSNPGLAEGNPPQRWNAVFGRLRQPVAASRVSPSLTNGISIVGLLSRPKWELRDGFWVTNYVAALVRSISGPAIEKAGLGADLAFTYVLTSELVPAGVYPLYYPPAWTNFTAVEAGTEEYVARSNRWAQLQNLAPNCSELRIVLHGPAVPGEKVGTMDSYMTLGKARTFRTLINGRKVRFAGADSTALLACVQPGSFRREGP